MVSLLIVRGTIDMSDYILKAVIVIGLILILNSIGDEKNGK